MIGREVDCPGTIRVLQPSKRHPPPVLFQGLSLTPLPPISAAVRGGCCAASASPGSHDSAMAEDIDERSDTGTPTWATLADAAAVFRVSSKTIRRAVRAGAIRGERTGDSSDSPWLVSLKDVEARWGDKARTNTSDLATSAEQGETSTEMQNTAQAGDVEAGDPTVNAEIRNQRVGERLSELRKSLVVSEPKRRWWQRPNQ